MDKQQIIGFIEGQLASGKISKDDLMQLAGGSSGVNSSNINASSQPTYSATQTTSAALPTKDGGSKSVTKVFYAIGVIVVLLGVITLIAQNWYEIGFLGRIMVTLGIAVLTYISGLMMRDPEQRVISQVMFIISTALAPMGVVVLLTEAEIDFTWSTQILASLALFAMYGIALLINRRSVLVLITIGFGTWTYFSLVAKFFSYTYLDSDVLKWAVILLGVAYFFIGAAYQSLWRADNASEEREKSALGNVLYGAATISILGTVMSMGGIFDLFLIALIFAAFYASVFLKSKLMLAIAALFLIVHIIKLTSEYFIDSIGWSVALILAGFLIIGIGYITFYINRKYISGK